MSYKMLELITCMDDRHFWSFSTIIKREKFGNWYLEGSEDTGHFFLLFLTIITEKKYPIFGGIEVYFQTIV